MVFSPRHDHVKVILHAFVCFRRRLVYSKDLQSVAFSVSPSFSGRTALQTQSVEPVLLYS